MEREDMKLEREIRRTISCMRPPISSKCCIYRVPKSLRDVNEAAYTPQVVSIGPLHHGKETLKNMEAYKLRYLQHLLEFDETRVSLNELISSIRRNETRIRECYVETIDYLSSDEFVKMVLLDATFIIQFFSREAYGVQKFGENYDFIFHTFRPIPDIRRDLILLENQLPFFILEVLYDLTFRSFLERSFLDLTLVNFLDYNKQGKAFPGAAKHFTDLVRYFQLPCPPPVAPPYFQLPCPPPEAPPGQTKTFQRKVFDLVKKLIHKPRSNNERADLLYSATQLHEAGVKFEVSASKCLFDVQFSNGKLVMPCFKFEDSTESFIRNLMAFEQCHYLKDNIICNYMFFMDYLINTEKDVELLIQKKVMVNWLGDHHEAADLVNKLGKEIMNPEEGHYSNIIRQLNEYYEMPHHRWKAALRHEYFRSPWRAASTIAAIILLVLTAIQTFSSVLGNNDRHSA